MKVAPENGSLEMWVVFERWESGEKIGNLGLCHPMDLGTNNTSRYFSVRIENQVAHLVHQIHETFPVNLCVRWLELMYTG